MTDAQQMFARQRRRCAITSVAAACSLGSGVWAGGTMSRWEAHVLTLAAQARFAGLRDVFDPAPYFEAYT